MQDRKKYPYYYMSSVIFARISPKFYFNINPIKKYNQNLHEYLNLNRYCNQQTFQNSHDRRNVTNFHSLIGNQREIFARTCLNSSVKSGLIPASLSRNREIFLLLTYTRSMSTSKTTKENNEVALRDKYKPKECRFKTPYGHIAGLEWGESTAPHKILCLHGWLDNAGSFERLIPYVLDHSNNADRYHIIAFDQPGVGLSSHLPAGSLYTTFTTIVEMKRILTKLNWERFTLLSHSLGAHLSFIYSCIYPNQVESFISIDLAQPITRVVRNWQITIANSIEDNLRCEYHYDDDPTNNILVPVYSDQDALKRLMDGHSNSLTRESAEVLMKRGAMKQKWGYTFNRDVRLRHLSPELRPTDELMLQYLEEAFCPNLLIIRAIGSVYHRPENIRLKYYQLFNKCCPIFRDVLLEGTHHLHLNNPDTVATEVNKFLDEVRSKSDTTIINKSNL